LQGVLPSITSDKTAAFPNEPKNHHIMSEFGEVVNEGKRSLAKRLKKLLLYMVLLAIVGFGIFLLVCNFTISKGSSIGQLSNITYKGILFKTYEGTLNTGIISLNNNNNLPPDKMTQSTGGWYFSVPKQRVYEKLDNLQGQRVKLFYKKKFRAMPWQGKTNYFVYDVEVVK
jgi:hypothetical protein